MEIHSIDLVWAMAPTVEYDSFIKSQLASPNQHQGQMRCKFGNGTVKSGSEEVIAAGLLFFVITLEPRVERYKGL